jgi:protein-tyrosine-phosphatase/predicted ATP-grasp superfamily ATP-dependent carboligase
MTKTDEPPRILITDGQTLSALGAARSLGRAGHRVTLAWPEGCPPPPAGRSRSVADTRIYPDPWNDQAAFMDWLNEGLIERRWDVLLPVGEAAMLSAGLLRRRLPDSTLFALAPEATLRYTLSRYQSTRLAQQLGLHVPRTVYVSDGAGTQTWDQNFSLLSFPIRIIVDPYWDADGTWRRGYARSAETGEQAIALLRDLSGLRAAIIAQETLAGGGYAVNLLIHQGRIARGFAERALHEIPGEEGVVALCESYRKGKLMRLARQLAYGVGLEGLVRVEFRLSPDDNRFRFTRLLGGVWDSMALALHCGVDFPRDYIDSLRRRSIFDESEAGDAGDSTTGGGDEDSDAIRTDYPVGRRCCDLFPRELQYLAAVWRTPEVISQRRRPSRIGALASSIGLGLNPWVRHDRFWWNDPMPGLIETLRESRRLIRRSSLWTRRAIGRRRDAGTLAGVVDEHRRRMASPLYFEQPPRGILFVGWHDLCRGPFARRYWRRLLAERRLTGPDSASAGFQPPAGARPPVRILRQSLGYRLDLQTHRSQILTADLIDQCDVIMVMDGRDYRQLLRRFPRALGRAYFLGLFAAQETGTIPDPTAMPPWEADEALRLLARSLECLMARIVADAATRRIVSKA